MPNLIHSLDASNIHLLTLKLDNTPLYTIHDCFATTPNNMSFKHMEELIKLSFIEIYFKDRSYIENMDMNLHLQLNSYIPRENIIYNKDEKYVIIEKDNKKIKIRYT